MSGCFSFVAAILLLGLLLKFLQFLLSLMEQAYGISLALGSAITFIIIVGPTLFGFFFAKHRRERRTFWEALRSQAGPELGTFCQTYRDTQAQWPKETELIAIPEEDKQSLIRSLRNKGIAIDYQTIPELIKKEFAQQNQSQFELSFLAIHQGLTKESELSAWATAYVDTFTDNFGYLPFLKTLVSKLSGQNKGIWQGVILQQLVHGEVKKRTQANKREGRTFADELEEYRINSRGKLRNPNMSMRAMRHRMTKRRR